MLDAFAAAGPTAWVLLAAAVAVGLVLVVLTLREARGREHPGVAWAAGPVCVLALGASPTFAGFQEAGLAGLAAPGGSGQAVMSAGLAAALAPDALASLLGGALLLGAAVGVHVRAFALGAEEVPPSGPRRLLTGFLVAAGVAALARSGAEVALSNTYAGLARSAPELRSVLLEYGHKEFQVIRAVGQAAAALALVVGFVSAAPRYRELIGWRALLRGGAVVALFVALAAVRASVVAPVPGPWPTLEGETTDDLDWL